MVFSWVILLWEGLAYFGQCHLWGREFNNQVNRIWCSLNSQPLSPPNPVITQWVHELSFHSARNVSYGWAQQNTIPLIKADLATTAAECLTCQQQRPTLSPSYCTICQGDQSVKYSPIPHGVFPTIKLTTLDHFLHETKRYPYWSRYLFWLWICFSCT